MSRTPDWCLYQFSPDPELCKPRIVLEVGDAQPLAHYCGTAQRENLRDRAVAWLTTTFGITQAVILVNLARRLGMVDCGGVQKQWVTSIQVTVELWRLVAAAPVCVESVQFVVRENDEVDVEGGLRLLPEDVYDVPTPHRNEFVLEYAWLQQHLLQVWPLARRQWIAVAGAG